MTIARLIESRNAADIVTCDADASVREAVALLAQHRIGAMPVFEGDRLAGMFSERDVIRQLQAQGPAVLDRKLREVMSSPPVTVGPDTSVLAALALITHRRVRHLPVISDGRMVGLVSIGDLVKYRIDRIETEAEALRTYIQTA
jgi:CBS domain-containing protein